MKYLIIFLIVIGGIGLIYLAALYFFPQTPPKEISFKPEETATTTPLTEEKMEYLAPDFELSNLEGEKNKLSDYKNKIVVLTFWTTWNSVAQDQFVILDSYYQKVKEEEDLVLLIINNQEDKSVVSSFISRGGYKLPVLLDESGEIGELYKIQILPATYFVNKEGEVKDIYLGLLNEVELERRIERLHLE